ncbi:MAG TPA: HAD family hydrolase [Fimbriimonadaceae bacterium]|nr:HAD family hydrolase [Fimbriimonadaceae bacterium]
MSEPSATFGGDDGETIAPHLDFSEIRAIFFDLDDTLCAYWEASKFGMRRAFELHGPEGFTVEEMVRYWAAAFREFSPTLKQTGWYDGYLKSGEPTRTEQMRLTLFRMGIVDEERAKALSQAYFVERDRALRLFDDSEFVLQSLSKRYPLGLITNGPADIQRQEIRTLGIERFFRHILIEGEMGEGKPNPTVFARALQAIDGKPEEILFVGNSYAHDVSPALACGWRAVWVRRATDVPPSAGIGPSLPEEMPAGGQAPDAVIANLSELLDMLPL